MTIDEMRDLWDLAGVIHEARIKLAWGRLTSREPWPDGTDKYLRAYPHSPIAYVDLALASAKAVTDNFKIDLSLAAGPAMSEVGMSTIQ
jgi:hypothetical protein